MDGKPISDYFTKWVKTIALYYTKKAIAIVDELLKV